MFFLIKSFLFKSESSPIPVGGEKLRRLLDQGIPRIEGLQNFAAPQVPGRSVALSYFRREFLYRSQTCLKSLK